MFRRSLPIKTRPPPPDIAKLSITNRPPIIRSPVGHCQPCLGQLEFPPAIAAMMSSNAVAATAQKVIGYGEVAW
jgi:hypothetical protein